VCDEVGGVTAAVGEEWDEEAGEGSATDCDEEPVEEEHEEEHEEEEENDDDDDDEHADDGVQTDDGVHADDADDEQVSVWVIGECESRIAVGLLERERCSGERFDVIDSQ
jgi:hypothetical protein